MQRFIFFVSALHSFHFNLKHLPRPYWPQKFYLAHDAELSLLPWKKHLYACLILKHLYICVKQPHPAVFVSLKRRCACPMIAPYIVGFENVTVFVA